MIDFLYSYKILSLGLSYPDEKNWAILEKLLMMDEIIFDDKMLSEMKRFKEYFLEKAHRIDDVKSEYLSIFDIGREISPYETEYMKEKVSRKPFELADIAGFYSAFGFHLDEDRNNKEALDHISVELEFMAILEWKEAYSRLERQQEHTRIVRDARIKFFKEHLATWGFFFCSQVQALEGDGFYQRLAKLLESVLKLDCERFGLDSSLFNKELSRDPYRGVRGDELTC